MLLFWVVAPSSAWAEADGLEVLQVERETFVYKGTGGRDPFVPPERPEGLTSPGQLRLVGVITGEERAVALFQDAQGRGFFVHRGDMLGTLRVLQVLPKRLILGGIGEAMARRDTVFLRPEGP